MVQRASDVGVFGPQPLHDFGRALARAAGQGHGPEPYRRYPAAVLQLIDAPFNPEQQQFAGAFDAAVLDAQGHHAFNEAVRRDIAHGGGAGSTIVVDGGTVAYLWRIDTADAHWELTVAHDGGPEAGAIGAVVHAALGRAAARGGGGVVAWVPGDDRPTDDALTAAGLALDRVLLQLRVPLPVAEPPSWPDGVAVHPYRPAVDADAFLAVNNAAFAGHPEQGGWDRRALEARLAQPWVDPGGFLLAWDGDELLGFNWMKLHSREAPPEPLGEIYAVGVAPAAQGRGLGRALALAGLQWAAQSVPTGMLYVDRANSAAVGMYESLGFTEHHRHRAYAGTVRPR